MDPSSRRTESFRPLELSIYLPGNELSPLPSFSEDFGHEPAGLEFPAQALVKSRSDPILSRSSTTFTIPRKPVGSIRNLSVDESRYSIDSHYTLPSMGHTSRAQSMTLRQNVNTSQSTQDFLDSLDTRLPKSPPPLRIRSGSEPIFTLHRRASDQNLRLRTHLEERQEIEKRLNEFDTIIEEKQVEAEQGPVRVPSTLIKDITITEEPISETKNPSRTAKTRPSRSMTSPEQFTKKYSPLPFLPHPAPLRSAPFPPSGIPSKVLSRVQQIEMEQDLNTKLAPVSTQPSTRSRISQWLLRSSPTRTSSSSSSIKALEAAPDFYQCSPPSLSRNRSSTISSTDTVDRSEGLGTPWTTPRGSPHRKEGSLSSCLGRGMSLDIEKGVVELGVVEVGMAF
ncbi:hypothetical protein MMC08_008356 [Hypocenomyce scalaris]|nr:hypothetical protein [Hypocenomyce scalaris]